MNGTHATSSTHLSPSHHHKPIAKQKKKKDKVGSLKRWFSRFGSSSSSSSTTKSISEEKAHSEIERKLTSLAGQKTMSMLLLGAGGSGKSTVLKQMERIHRAREGVPAETRDQLWANIQSDMHDLCRQYLVLKQSEEALALDSSDCENLAIQMATTQGGVGSELLLTPDYLPLFAEQVATLWAAPAMQRVFEIRRKSHIMDNTPYFMQRVRQYADPGYDVTFDDYVRIRDQTTGWLHFCNCVVIFKCRVFE